MTMLTNVRTFLESQWQALIHKVPFIVDHKNQIVDLLPIFIQLAIIFLCFAVSRRLYFVPFRQSLMRWPHVEQAIEERIRAIWFMLLLVLARSIFTAASVNVSYFDIALMAVAAWFIPSMFKQSTLSNTNRRILIFSMWALLAILATDKLDPLITFLDSARLKAGDINISLWSVIKVTGIFVLLVWVVSSMTRVIDTFMQRSVNITPSARALISKLVNISGIVLGFLITLNLFGIDLSMFAFFGGALGIGIGFGLQKIVSNFISGIILVTDKSIKPGDVLSIGQHIGQITSLRARYVVMRKRDGTEVLIPNENLMITEVINWSYNNRKVRISLEIAVDYQCDLEQVQKILLTIARESPRVLENPEPRAFINSFDSNFVKFELRFWIVDPEEGLGNIKGVIYMEIWKRFRAENIRLAYQQRVIHFTDPHEKALLEQETAAPPKK